MSELQFLSQIFISKQPFSFAFIYYMLWLHEGFWGCMRLKYLKIIVQTQMSTIQDHSELLYLSQNSLFLSLTSFQNINVCTETPCKLSSINQKTQSTVNTEIEHNLKKDAVELHTSDLFYARCQYQQRIVEYWDLNHWKLSYWVKSVHFVSVDSRKVLNQRFLRRKRKGLKSTLCT